MTAQAAVHLACCYLRIRCLGSPPRQQDSIGLFLQLDRIPCLRCPPPCSGIAATTSTGDLTAAALNSYVNDGSGGHGPLGLNISSLLWDLVNCLPELVVEDIPFLTESSIRCSQQTLAIHLGLQEQKPRRYLSVYLLDNML